MKLLRWIAYFAAALGALLIILASIGVLIHKHVFGFAHPMNFYMVADSVLLLAIALFIASKQCCCNCCETKEEKK